MNQGKRSLEQLYHYRCGSCNLWFSVGDPKEQPRFCPFCGVEQTWGEEK